MKFLDVKLAILLTSLLLFIGISGCGQAEQAKQAVGIEAVNGEEAENGDEREDDDLEQEDDDDKDD